MAGKYEWWAVRRPIEWHLLQELPMEYRRRYFWHYRAPGNHEIIYQGKTNGYRSKKACLRAIELAMGSGGAEIVEV